MKILIITPRIPYPPYRGDKLKIFNIAKILGKNNEVTILTFQRSNSQNSEIVEFRKLGFDLITVKLTIFESLLRTFGALFTKLPFQSAWYKSSLMLKKIKEVAPDYDVVYYHLIRSAQYFYKSENTKTLNVLDFTDAVSLYLSRFVKAEKNPFKKIFIELEKKRITAYEKVAEKFDVLFICSEVDKKFLIDKGLNVNIEILNNGIDTDYFSADNFNFEENRIIFTGNMPYYPNYDAAIYFCKDIFPKVLNKIPDAKFFIVGQNPSIKIRNLSSNNITVTGFVQDIKQEYLKSAVNIAPMRFGAGTLNKVIESIALGVPIVATSFAVQGLPENLKKYILVADDSKSFSEKVIEVLQNNAFYRDKMKEGQKVIRETLSWEKVVADFEKSLHKKVENKKNSN